MTKPSLTQFINDNYSYIRGFALKQSFMEVDDMCQEMLLRVTKHYPKYKPKYAPTTWLYGVLRSTISEMYRYVNRERRKIYLLSLNGVNMDWLLGQEQLSLDKMHTILESELSFPYSRESLLEHNPLEILEI